MQQWRLIKNSLRYRVGSSRRQRIIRLLFILGVKNVKVVMLSKDTFNLVAGSFQDVSFRWLPSSSCCCCCFGITKTTLLPMLWIIGFVLLLIRLTSLHCIFCVGFGLMQHKWRCDRSILLWFYFRGWRRTSVRLYLTQ